MQCGAMAPPVVGKNRNFQMPRPTRRRYPLFGPVLCILRTRRRVEFIIVERYNHADTISVPRPQLLQYIIYIYIYTRARARACVCNKITTVHADFVYLLIKRKPPGR